MSHLNDLKYAKLLANLGGALYTGPKGINDMELAWLKTQTGVTADQIEDAWHQLWDAVTPTPIPDGGFNDRAYAWLGGLGYTQGHINERWAAYWGA